MSQAFINSCVVALSERVLREGHHVSGGEETPPVGGPGVTSRRGERVARGGGRGCGAHARRFKVTLNSQLTTSARVVAHSVPFTSARTNGHGNRYSPERGYRRVFVPRGIYVSTLWTPTLLVHHLLSQSSRLTRQIDMRQARDYVSIQIFTSILNFPIPYHHFRLPYH